jgi:hypothetical protein
MGSMPVFFKTDPAKHFFEKIDSSILIDIDKTVFGISLSSENYLDFV